MKYERTEGGILLPKHELIVGGFFDCEIVRAGKTIDKWRSNNLVVNEGLNALLNIMFNSSSQVTNWYLGIFQGNYTPVSSDTASVIAANSTECSSYTSPTRPAWQQAAASAQSITNSANKATFTFNSSQTIYGAFLISNSTIGGTAGILFSAAQFSASKNVVNLDQLLLTYTFNASSA